MLLASVQTEAQFDDDAFPPVQTLQGLSHRAPVFFQLNGRKDAVLFTAQNVGKQQLVAVLVHIQRLVDGHFLPQAGGFSDEHENFVFNAFGSVGGQLDAFVRTEGVDGLYQSYGADGDQILNVDTGVFKFFGNVHDQA